MNWRKKVSAALAAILLINSAEGLSAFGLQAFGQEIVTEQGAQEEQQERSVLFNEGWRFQVWPNAGKNKRTYSQDDRQLASKDYDDSAWRKLDLPHDWSIEEDFTSEVSVEYGALPTGIGWYRKSFVLPAEDAGRRVNLDFGGVFANCQIYVNGIKVGEYYYGYNAFSFDITDYVTCDGETQNLVAVKVDSPQNGSRWYTGSGIYRNVYLTVTDAVHVGNYGTAVYAPDLEQEYPGGQVTTRVQTTVENEGAKEAKVRVKNTILDYESGEAFEGAQPKLSDEITLAPGEKQEITQDITAVNPQLWSVDTPNLYRMKTEVISNGSTIDTYETRFGYKWCRFDSEEGFSLNGEWMKIKGVCMHHDQGALGAAAYEAAIYRQMKIMKEMGANAIRVTHNPADEALIKACDELGLMVVEEAFDGWWSAKDSSGYAKVFHSVCTHPDAQEGITWGAYDFQQMIRKDRNAPSIILWSVGNEVYESGDAAVEWIRKAVKELAPQADPAGHLVTMGDNQFKRITSFDASGSRARMNDELDIVGLNYSEEQYDSFHNSWKPNWILYGSETASAVSSRGWYSDPDKTTGAAAIEEYHLSSYDNSCVSWGRTATDSLIPDRDRKFIAGQFVWTGFDYIGEPSPFGSKGGSSSSGPKSSYFGIVDTAGFAKDSYYLYQSQWLDASDNPMVHILPHWNWEDDDLRKVVTVDGKIPVRVYSNGASVELFVNGVSQGKKEFAKKTTAYGLSYQQQSQDSDRLYLEWPLAWSYAEGTTIEAIAYDESGKEIAKDRIVTAGQAAALSAQADRFVIEADGSDLSYITVDVEDANGNFVPTADNEISFHISGDGEIVGVDNGDAASWERYKDYDGIWKRKAYSGKALVIVKSTKEAGSFTLTASSAGLSQDSVTVYTTAGKVQEDTVLGYETVSLTVEEGTKPEEIPLPETVSKVMADGSKEQEAVTWEELDDSLIQIGEYEIKGKTTGGADVKAVLTVRGPIGVKEITVGVLKGEIPKLPGTVELVWSDGKRESRKVAWENVSSEQTANPGIMTIRGAVEDESRFEAKAHIVVLERTVKENVALSEKGASVSVSYQEGSHLPSYLIDGIIDSDSNGWGNWQKEGRFEDWATIEFSKEYTVSEAIVRMNDAKTWQLPDRILISYWDEAAQAYLPVSNQSKTEGFVNNRQANTIAFDPVTTSKLRFTFYIDGGAYASGKDMLKINEIEVYAQILQLNHTAVLEELAVNGAGLDGFAAEQYYYFYKVGYLEETPKIEAKAADGATVFVRQALSGNGQAVVEVTSQDGAVTNTYIIQFSKQSPALSQVEFTDLPKQVREDDVVTLQMSGRMEDDSVLDAGEAAVAYEIIDGEDGGHGEIQGGKLYAYTKGSVTIIGKMTYQGVTCETEPQTVLIEENTEEREAEALEEITLRVKRGTIPELPEEITVYYKNALPRKAKVTWNPVGEEIYQNLGSFEVTGQIEGVDLKPKAVITMVDMIAAQNLSEAVMEGYTAVLPRETTVYYNDGQTEKAEVVWEEEPGAQTSGICRGHIKDSDIPVTCTVRRTQDGQISENYVIKYNGWGLPDGLASFTNDTVINASAKDSATYVNDGYSEFTNGADKQIWCNYVPSTLDKDKVQRQEDWIAATIAVSGKIVEKTVDRVRFGVIDEESSSTKTVKVPKAYYVEYYVGPDYSNMLMERYTTAGISYGGHMADATYWPDNPLMDSENWQEVTYRNKAAIPSGKNGDWKQMLEVTFEPVETSLVRLRMEAYEDYCLGVNELEVYGTAVKAEDTVEGADILVDEESCIEAFEGRSLTWKLDIDETFPQITAAAANNAAVTVVPPTDQNPTATILFVPEDGNEVNTRSYQITFEREESDIAARAEAAKKAAEAARAAADEAAQAAEASGSQAKQAEERALAAADQAKQAQEAAEAAREAAEKAKQDAQAAGSAASADEEAAATAAKRAESAEAAAKEALANAIETQEAAEAAQAAAQQARTQAQAAEHVAQEAQNAAQTAQEAAEAAQRAAELAKTDAEAAEQEAKQAQQEAEAAKNQAAGARDTAVAAYESAESLAAEAAEAVKAAEAAKQAAQVQAELAQAYASAAEAAAGKALAAETAAVEAAKRAQEAWKQAEDKLRQTEKEAKEQLAKMEQLLAAEKFRNTGIKLKKAKAGKKSMKVSWNTVKGADGYEIQYATKASFKGKKTIVVKGGKKASKTLKKLKSKKTYYVRIRAYQQDGNIYTRYSKTKKVRIK